MNAEEKKSTLDRFFASLDPASSSIEDLETDSANRQVVAEGDRPCPICGEKMVSEKTQGILIDVCEAHGVWMDKGELSSVIRRSKEDAVKEAMQTAGDSGQDHGFLLGYALGTSLE